MKPNDAAADEEKGYEFIFGFGSIMNSSTHAPWFESSSDVKALPGRSVRIKQEFGYERQWNFRSTTGFTALGVCRTRQSDLSPKKKTMNGVIFQVPLPLMLGFDRREVGYDKVRIPLEYIEFCDDEYRPCTLNKGNLQSPAFQLTAIDKIWIYVPQASQCREADENHPLLQSYVDTVLQGCLEWGGETMAEDFVLSTGGWSAYFLNDTPSSRRPWLFRKDYDTIDAILRKHSDRTRYGDRRHPEEFASTFLLQRMRGTWSIPRRNRHFTGRDNELGSIHARLTQQQQDEDFYPTTTMGGSVNFLFVQGMGGVGKSSICTEYCYRHFPSSYGLVVWLNAESAETLVADYRQLLADLADGLDAVNTTMNAAAASSSSQKDSHSSNNSTDEVIGEVKTRLFRCKVPWLLVFDNLEDRKLLEKFVPRGAASGCKGHVLVTTRLVELESGSGPSSLVLGCLSPSESVEMLRRALGGRGGSTSGLLEVGSQDEEAAREICDKLGHLPLALGMAAAYMQRCDVSCVEYVERYVRFEETGRSLLRHQAGRLHDYSLTVSASLSLSLKAIDKESNTASEVLKLLCWMGPDQITKALLRGLLTAKIRADKQRRLEEQHQADLSPDEDLKTFQYLGTASALLLVCGLALGSATLVPLKTGHSSRLHIYTGMLAALSLSASMATIVLPSKKAKEQSTKCPKTPPPSRIRSSGELLDEFEQSDVIWNILKSFSILTVKEGKGSMHRLLAQALRASQSEEESCHHLKICIDSMSRIWQFDPRKADTWQDSFHVVEHVKSLVSHVANNEQDVCTDITLQAGILSKEAGVFSAMAMNGFKEAQASLELALKIFEHFQQGQKPSSDDSALKARAEALHELGRVLRYQGDFAASEETLLGALSIRNKLASIDVSENHSVADTLHELGVLEVKKHSLDTAESYLTRALDLRRDLDELHGHIDADSAATLHQLAAVHVARKPPALGQAEVLLQEALTLSRQIGQRAATLKQLARVTIRQGLLDRAEDYLRRALELYNEIYGERTMHINVAAVKFQQGALAFQREQFEQAWIHFSECLRIRRHVYAYARDSAEEDVTQSNPLHLEVSCVLHELGCVGFSQGLFPKALSMLQAEMLILQKMQDSSTQTDRVRQAMLTNLTWLRKCAKEMGDEAAATQFAAERAQLKSTAKMTAKETTYGEHSASKSLQREALQCRVHVRQFALSKTKNALLDREVVLGRLSILAGEIDRSPSGSMKDAAQEFHDELMDCLKSSTDSIPRSTILKACDTLRDVLRAHGAQVSDSITN